MSELFLRNITDRTDLQCLNGDLFAAGVAFDKFGDGVDKVASGGTVIISAGSTSATRTLSKPMTIQASGGTVTIGGP